MKSRSIKTVHSILVKAFLIPVLMAFLLPVVCRADAVDLSGFYTLENGLDVRLMAQPAASVAAVLVLVKTGYEAEGSGKSGFSHLLEHLVFEGTSKRSSDEIRREVDDLGSYINGFTRDDFTGYLIVGHRDHLRQNLEILSDMLFNSTITEQSVRKAREVVLEEIRRMESRPETRENALFQALLYEGSPYAKIGLGNETTVSSVTRDEVYDFYKKTYRPNNMVLMIKGGVDRQEALEAIRESFGAAPVGPAAAAPSPAPSMIAKRTYILGTPIKEVRVRIGFDGPDPRSGDAEAVELFLGVLGGTDGVLDRALTGAGMTPRSVEASLHVKRGFSRIVISATLPDNSDPVSAKTVLLEAISAAITSKQFPQWMNDTRNAMAADEIMAGEKFHYYLMGISQWVIAGSPGQGTSPGRWDGLEAEDLVKVAQRYMEDKPFIALLTIPEEKRKAGTFTSGAPVQAKAKLDNGIEVIAEQRPGSPVFAMHIMTRNRSAMEPLGKKGIADFLHRLLPLGTNERKGEELESEMRSLGVSITTAGNPMTPFGDFYTSRLYSWIRLECLEDNADKAAALLAEMVKSPRLSADAVEEVRAQMLGFIAYNNASPGKVASRLLAEALYGNSLAPDVYGSEKSISSITREDLQKFHREYFTGRNLIITVVSGMSPDQSVSMVRRFFSDLPPGSSSFTPEPVGLTEGHQVRETELGKPQGAYAAGAVTAFAGTEAAPVLDVVSAILNTRLTEQLREREGLAYSLGASLGEVGGKVVFAFSMGTSPDKIERARKALREQIAEAKRGYVTAAQIERGINGLVGRLQMRMLSSINRAFYIGLAARDKLSHTFDDDYRQILMKLRSWELEEAMDAYLPGENLVEVLVR